MINKDGKKVSTKPWVTKEWKEMRKKLIKDKCEQCGGTEKLTLQHLKQPQGYSVIWRTLAQTMFEEWMSKIDKDSLQKKVNDIWEYMDNKLPEIVADERLTKRKRNAWKKNIEQRDEHTLKWALFKLFKAENKSEISAKAMEKAQESHKQYMSGQNTATFCKKCAFLWDMKGQKLCPKCKIHYCYIFLPECDICSGKAKLCDKCKKNYHSIRYPTCFNCSSKKQEWEKFSLLYEIDELLEDGCPHDPQCPIISWRYTEGGGGGYTNKCVVEKVRQKYPNSINCDMDIKEQNTKKEI
ncbi:MAG: hypothetical protein V1701_03740 [Planctomycetota bacterium]